MKVMRNNKWKKFMTTVSLCGCLIFASTVTTNVYASTGNGINIEIEKPEEWTTGNTNILITIDSSNLEDGIDITKVESKVGESGEWQDISDTKTIVVNGNDTVFVRVTDSNGTVYEQNRSIKTYDEEKPTLSASLTDGVITITGYDSISGISSISVNGTEYTELKDDGIQIQLTQKDFDTKQFEILAKDKAGNQSQKYILKNPYYGWNSKQTETSNNNMTTNSTNTPATSTEKPSSPLPQYIEPSKPTESRGTVEDKTVTKVEETVAASGEQTESITKTGVEGSKEFFTISTKSGKVFYLIIDNEKADNNVYFLTEASEQDLMNFTLSETQRLPDMNTVYAQPEQIETDKEDLSTKSDGDQQKESKVEEDHEVEMPEDRSPLGSYLLIGLLVIGVGLAGYYIKIYKPQHEYDDFDDEDENEGEDPEEEEVEDETDTEDVLEDEDDEE